jgi:hypothetical protein
MRIIASVIICCVIICSCQKKTSDTDTNPPQNPVPQGPSPKPDMVKYLSRITISNLLNEQSESKIEWKYDNAKRCTHVTTKRYSNNGNDSLTITMLQFFYNGTESQPYRIEESPRPGNQNMSYNTYFFYGSDGRKIKDSTISTHPACGSLLLLSNYTYKSDKVYMEYKMKNIDYTCTILGSMPKTNYDTIYFTGDNVSKVTQNGSKNTLRKDSFSYTHDSKINPFNKINISSSFYFIGPSFGYRMWSSWYCISDNLYIIGRNKNNILKTQQIGMAHNQEFIYTYDSTNYPISTKTKVTDGSTTYEAFIKYEYLP